MRIAQLLHYKYRAEKDGSKRDALKSHVESFQRDFVNRALPPHPRASLHLISYFKESKNYDTGIEFWNWVIEQDDNYISLGAYGAAIELLAYYGKDLEYCEAVYKHALTRFAIHFNEYHLSPGAIVPDRAQHMITAGTSMQLLQGILTARLLRRDWRNAYLTLDTALRIHPSQIPSRFIDLFLMERPLQEAYQVFCLACRAGNIMSGPLLTTVLQHLYTAMSNREAGGFNLDLVGAMFNAIHAFVGSAGRLETPHMNVLLKGVLSVLTPNDHTESFQMLSEQGKTDRNVLGMMALIPEVFGTLGLSPERSTFNTLIQMGGMLKHPELIAFAAKAFSYTGCSPDANTFRSLQTAAGRLRDPVMMKSSWTEFVRFVAAQGAEPGVEDWSAFVGVAKRAGMEDVITELMPTNPQHMAPESKAPNPATKQDTGPGSSQSSIEPHTGTDSQSFEQISAELKFLRKRLGSRLTRNLKTLPLNRISITPWTPCVDENWQQRLYDELTLDLAAPTAGPSDKTQETETERPTPVVKTATGFPLDELRYLNWKSVNDLLMQAEPFEARKERLVDDAIAQGNSVRKSETSRSKKPPGKDSTYGTATVRADLEEIIAACTQGLTESEWREKIFRLRETGCQT